MEAMMKDTQFMTAEEKRKVLRQWELFLKDNLGEKRFTKALYEHLILHCEFIAHFSRGGFYNTYFTSGEGITLFLRQFDKRNARENGIPESVEYGLTYWGTGNYADVNRAMIEVATPYIPNLLQQAQDRQREADTAEARRLLARWEKP